MGRIIGYARVSTKSQAKEGNSLEQQKSQNWQYMQTQNQRKEGKINADKTNFYGCFPL